MQTLTGTRYKARSIDRAEAEFCGVPQRNQPRGNAVETSAISCVSHRLDEEMALDL